jgi:hypothetical protein
MSVSGLLRENVGEDEWLKAVTNILASLYLLSKSDHGQEMAPRFQQYMAVKSFRFVESESNH